MTRVRTLAAGSIAVGLIVLALKYVAYHLTGSVALLSDAIESIVNVATAIAALLAINFAAQPADAGVLGDPGEASVTFLGADRIDILRCCDDYGTQRGMLFNPAMWDDFFAENTRRFTELAHRHNCFYMQHSCGAIRSIIPNLIACGVDVIEPLQKVPGLEVDGLKRDFGDVLAFQGGVDTQGVLPLGTADEVRAETTRIIRALHRNGGYILAPSQDFEGDVPVENILAMYEAGIFFR